MLVEIINNNEKIWSREKIVKNGYECRRGLSYSSMVNPETHREIISTLEEALAVAEDELEFHLSEQPVPLL